MKVKAKVSGDSVDGTKDGTLEKKSSSDNPEVKEEAAAQVDSCGDESVEVKKPVELEEDDEEDEFEDEGTEDNVDDDDEGDKKPATMEDLEKRIKWLEMDAKRAKSRRSRMVRMERKMRTWQMYLDANPTCSSLGLTVEHIMESMFGADGLRTLSASQIGALEDLHFAAIRHLSDAKVEIAKRQAILDLKGKK